MTIQQDDTFRSLKRKHQQLLRRWKKSDGPCVICGKAMGREKDHLPPKVLFPESMRNPQTEFFTFPACTDCNRTSADEDFLFSVLLSMKLNQESILGNQEPTDPDLLALYNQASGHMEDPQKVQHRRTLLQKHIGTDPKTGRPAIDISSLPTNHTTTKIVRSIYWLHTDGDILQSHNPGWWIIPLIETSRTNFVEKHLKTTHADVHWEGRFIAHFSYGHPRDGVGGFISCSLHFYTERQVGKGMSWLIMASPKATAVAGTSLYEHSVSKWGPATIEPQE